MANKRITEQEIAKFQIHLNEFDRGYHVERYGVGDGCVGVFQGTALRLAIRKRAEDGLFFAHEDLKTDRSMAVVFDSYYDMCFPA